MVTITSVGVALLLSSSLSLVHAAENTTADASGSSSASGSAPALSTTLKWGDCKFYSSTLKAASFECTRLTVPMCYEGNGLACGKGSSRTHSLAMLRRGSVSGSTKPTVWVVIDSHDTEDAAQLMYDISKNDTVQVFALQLRPWDFPTEVDASSRRTPCGDLSVVSEYRKQVDTPTMDAVKKCSEWLTEQFGVNGINAFSLDTAAKDLTRAMSLLQTLEPSTTKSGVTVLSTGKASRVVQRFMAQNEINKDAPVVSGYIFDTPHAMKLQATQDKLTGATAMDRVISSCDTDTLCKSKFANISSTMSDVLKATYTTLDQTSGTSSACMTSFKKAAYDSSRDLKPSHGARRFFASLSRLASPGLKLLAPLLYRLHRCNADDTKVLDTLVEEIKSDINSIAMQTAQDERAMEQFVDRTITFSEFWPAPPPSQDQLVETLESTLVSDGAMVLQQPRYCAFTGGSAAGCSAVYKRESDLNTKLVLAYKAPTPASNTSVSATTGLIGSTTADVLIFASRLSPTGSSEVSQQLYDAFARDLSQRVLIQTDNVAGNYYLEEKLVGAELSGTHSETLARVVGLFVTKKAKALNGKWHVKDLAAFDFTSQKGALTSTFASAPLAFNFTVTDDEMGTHWRVFRRGRDLFETGDRLLGFGSSTTECTGSDCSSDKLNKVVAYGLSGMVVGFLVGGGVLLLLSAAVGYAVWRQCKARQLYYSGGRDTETRQQHAVAVMFPGYQQGPPATQPPPPQQQGYYNQQPLYTQQPGQYGQQVHQPAPYGSQPGPQQTWSYGAPVETVRPSSYQVI